MILEISNWSILKKALPEASFTKRVLENILEKHFFEYNFSSLGIIFVSEPYIRDINNQYRGVDSVTDVLSFGLGIKPFMGRCIFAPNILRIISTQIILKRR